MHNQHPRAAARAWMLSGCALAAFCGAASPALAQAQGAAQLEEVVVTAQKREQNLQDVPVAVSALTPTQLQNNRIASVQDLNAVAPNTLVKQTTGGIGIPQFTMRGQVSSGVVPGSDKSVSLYIDGVYLGANRGSIFELGEIERIEVLRGPQGTLFGRNSTAGAISIVTRDPPGEFGFQQQLTVGNYDQFRTKTRIDTPTWKSLSASLTYVHDQRDGDIKNLGAGMKWDRGLIPDEPRYATSPKTLGDKDQESVFLAVKFEPRHDLLATYKFDWVENEGTPNGVGLVAVGSIVSAFGFNPTPVYPDGKRPKSVNNWWATPNHSKSWGHNLTLRWDINDQLTVKNIFANRYTYVFSSFEYGGAGGVFAAPGVPFEILSLYNQAESDQWSDELQVNYDSELLTVTAGALYYFGRDRSGPPPGLLNAYSFQAFGIDPATGAAVIPRVPLETGLSFNKQKSKALYAQAELHATSQIDLLVGYRITKDNKEGSVNPTGTQKLPFTYDKAKPSYLLGVNYKPNDNVLLYGKYVTGYLSGGQVWIIPFAPETAESWEGGIKADWMDGRLRTNLTLFKTTYDHLQISAGGRALAAVLGAQPNSPYFPFVTTIGQLSTVNIDAGSAKAKGFEAEGSWLVMDGLTIGGSAGYTDFEITKFSPDGLALLRPGGVAYTPNLRSKWTATLYADYSTPPLFADLGAHIRIDANYQSRQRLDSYDDLALSPPNFQVLKYQPSTWMVNGRIALDAVKVAGGELQFALWGRNLTDADDASYPNLLPGLVASTNYIPARTWGLDVTFTY